MGIILIPNLLRVWESWPLHFYAFTHCLWTTTRSAGEIVGSSKLAAMASCPEAVGTRMRSGNFPSNSQADCRLVLDSHVAIALANHLVEICSSGGSSHASVLDGKNASPVRQANGKSNWLLNQQVRPLRSVKCQPSKTALHSLALIEVQRPRCEAVL